MQFRSEGGGTSSRGDRGEEVVTFGDDAPASSNTEGKKNAMLCSNCESPGFGFGERNLVVCVPWNRNAFGTISGCGNKFISEVNGS